MSVFKPAGPHNPLQAPAVCLCTGCSRWVLERRCQATDEQGRQCGMFRHRGREHSLIVETVFQIAAERVIDCVEVTDG